MMDDEVDDFAVDAAVVVACTRAGHKHHRSLPPAAAAAK